MNYFRKIATVAREAGGSIEGKDAMSTILQIAEAAEMPPLTAKEIIDATGASVPTVYRWAREDRWAIDAFTSNPGEQSHGAKKYRRADVIAGLKKRGRTMALAVLMDAQAS